MTSPYRAPGQISRDGHIAFASVQFSVPTAKISNSETLALMHDATAASGHGLRFSLGGDVVDLAETPYGGATDGIGTGAAAIVLLIAFGSVLAMGLPIVTALFGIGSGLSLIALIGHLIPAPVVRADRGRPWSGWRGRGLRAVPGDPVPRGPALGRGAGGRAGHDDGAPRAGRC